jgi:cytoskeletal protein RodZ
MARMGGHNSVVFGARMRQLRESRRISLRDIAEQTKISVSTLEALERDDISRLPGGIFSRAVVRSYAAAIGADPAHTVEEFMARFPFETVVVGSPSHRVETVDAPPQPPVSLAVVAAIVVPLVAILVWSLLA